MNRPGRVGGRLNGGRWIGRREQGSRRVHRHCRPATMPVAAIPHIGEEAGAVLMKLQERLALEIKDTRPPLDEQHSHAKHLEQIGQRPECACSSVLHQSFPVHSEGSDRTRSVVRLKHSGTGYRKSDKCAIVRHVGPSVVPVGLQPTDLVPWGRPGSRAALDTSLRRHDGRTPVRCTVCPTYSLR
jgi:hypothetical protein